MNTTLYSLTIHVAPGRRLAGRITSRLGALRCELQTIEDATLRGTFEIEFEHDEIGSIETLREEIDRLLLDPSFNQWRAYNHANCELRYSLI